MIIGYQDSKVSFLLLVKRIYLDRMVFLAWDNLWIQCTSVSMEDSFNSWCTHLLTYLPLFRNSLQQWKDVGACIGQQYLLIPRYSLV